jgi:hypothetical protein
VIVGGAEASQHCNWLLDYLRGKEELESRHSSLVEIPQYLRAKKILPE